MRSPLVCQVTLAALLFCSCEPEGEDDLAPSGAKISFRTDSGYTFLGDTVGLLDTLKVGVIATSGSDELIRFYLNVSYNDSTPVWKDTMVVDADPFTRDVLLVTRAFPGQEKWAFIVEEPDGDRTSRKLTFTVQ